MVVFSSKSGGGPPRAGELIYAGSSKATASMMMVVRSPESETLRGWVGSPTEEDQPFWLGGIMGSRS